MAAGNEFNRYIFSNNFFSGACGKAIGLVRNTNSINNYGGLGMLDKYLLELYSVHHN